MKTGVIIQARMASTRLPGKVAKELPYGSGITVLEQVIRRIKKCSLVDKVIVATTESSLDNIVVKLAKKNGADVFRGESEDVLARYRDAALKYGLTTIVRITSDCPCVDYEMVDRMIRRHLSARVDYTANMLSRTYPAGFDIEAFSMSALERLHKLSDLKSDREHVTMYIRNHLSDFSYLSVEAPASTRSSGSRVTLDTYDDYVFLCSLYDMLYSRDHFFGFKDVIKVIAEKPWLSSINRRSLGKKIHHGLKEELKEAATILDLQELPHAAALLRDILAKMR